jgi:hypothetical protein
VLLIDDNEESSAAKMLLDSEHIQYLVYHVQKFDESCCIELPSAKAPSLFAPEGLFKGLDGIQSYIKQRLEPATPTDSVESESAYW